MNTRLYALYWDNIDPAVVAAQKAVCDKLGLPLTQHRIHGMMHGEWIDWVMARNDDVDIFVFIDIDCIPLSQERIFEGLKQAAGGTLYGAEGAANHIDPNRSYAGAWYLFVNRKVWDRVGRPSAKPTPYADVAQNLTDVWRHHDAPVQLIAPTSCVIPKWDLPGRKLAYGIATTYGEDCFHLFESRQGDKTPFIDRCQQIISG